MKIWNVCHVDETARGISPFKKDRLLFVGVNIQGRF